MPATWMGPSRRSRLDQCPGQTPARLYPRQATLCPAPAAWWHSESGTPPQSSSTCRLGSEDKEAEVKRGHDHMVLIDVNAVMEVEVEMEVEMKGSWG